MYIPERERYLWTMPTTTRRAVLYARKSKNVGDGQSKSVSDQLDDCRRYAEGKGWEVVAELKDDGKSGATLAWQKRPEFAQAVEIFEAGGADTFVTLWTSRLSRDDEDRAALPKMLGALGVQWYAVEDGGLIETDTYAGWMQDGFRRLIDVGESKRKSEMWKATHRRRLEAGLPSSGRSRYGYVKNEDGRFEVEPITGAILREAYIRYTKGAGLQSLCAWLNDAGHQTSRDGAWGVQTLRRMLDSGFGAGLLIDKKTGTYSDGAHEGVITADEWQAFVDMRDKRKTLAPKRRVAGWHLAGLAVCSRCGGRVIKNGDNVLCSAYHNGRSCKGVWLRKAWLEQRVTLWLGAHIADFPERDVIDAGAENVVVDLESRLTDVQARLARVVDGYASGLLDADGVRAAQSNLIDERAEITTALRDAREEVARSMPINKDEFARLEVGDVSPGEWNALLARVLRRVEVHPDRLVIVPVVGEVSIISR